MNTTRKLVCRAMAMSWLATVAWSGCGAAVEMNGEVLYTIPWGDDWGQLKLVSAEELSEATYSGPSAMLATAGGDVYIYDTETRRLQRFSKDGKFSAGAQFPQWFSEPEQMVLCRPTPQGTQPLILVCYDQVFQLEKLDAQPGAASLTEPLKGALAARTRVLRVGAASWTLYVEECGRDDRIPYVRRYEGARYVRRFEITELVSYASWYYGLAVDCDTGVLQSPAGELSLKEIAASEGTIDRTIMLRLPDIEDKRLRWHLIAAGSLAEQKLFFFVKRLSVRSDEEVLVVTESGETHATARLTLPNGLNQDSQFRQWNRLVSVTEMGDLYFGLPTDTGFAVVRYRLPR